MENEIPPRNLRQTERALFERIRRRLARGGEHLPRELAVVRRPRALLRRQAENDSGHWRSRTLVATHLDLESLGRELGVAS
jgi:hypothetical protein